MKCSLLGLEIFSPNMQEKSEAYQNYNGKVKNFFVVIAML